MTISGGDCNVYQGLSSSAILTLMFTPSFDAISELRKYANHANGDRSVVPMFCSLKIN